MAEYTAFLCPICRGLLDEAGYEMAKAEREPGERWNGRCKNCGKIRDNIEKVKIKRRGMHDP